MKTVEMWSLGGGGDDHNEDRGEDMDIEGEDDHYEDSGEDMDNHYEDSGEDMDNEGEDDNYEDSGEDMDNDLTTDYFFKMRYKECSDWLKSMLK